MCPTWSTLSSIQQMAVIQSKSDIKMIYCVFPMLSSILSLFWPFSSNIVHRLASLSSCQVVLKHHSSMYHCQIDLNTQWAEGWITENMVSTIRDFQRFVSLKRKCSLVACLSARAYRIRSECTHMEEQRNTHTTLTDNGHPDELEEKCIVKSPLNFILHTTPREHVLIKLLSNCGKIVDFTRRTYLISYEGPTTQLKWKLFQPTDQ